MKPISLAGSISVTRVALLSVLFGACGGGETREAESGTAPAGSGGAVGGSSVSTGNAGTTAGTAGSGGTSVGVNAMGGSAGAGSGGAAGDASGAGGTGESAGSAGAGLASGGGGVGGAGASGGGGAGGAAASGGAAGTVSAMGGKAGAASGGASGSSGTAGAAGTGGTAGNAGTSSACNETSGLTASGVIYAAPTGSSAGSGDSFQSAVDLQTGLSMLGAGKLLLLQPGKYSIPYVAGQANTIELSKSGQSQAPLMIAAASCGRAVIDFSFPEQQWVQDSYGLSVTGSYWTLKGIDVTRAGYQGAYVTGQHNTFENCAFYDNRNTGLEINKGGAYTTVINTDAYHNYDPKKGGSMADGFGPKQTQGPGNVFIGCRAWENSDDGFDMFDSPEVVVIQSGWAFRNGIDIWGYGGFTGNGNGFKLGGNGVAAKNRITNSVAFENPSKGFDQNNNAGGLTILNCTSYSNGTNFGLGNPVDSGQMHLLNNNVSLGASVSISNADARFNSWNSGFSVSASDFQSVNVTQATVARNPDGTLPETPLFRLTAQSKLVDAGTDVGLPFTGSAPDLGAFERQN